MGKLDRSDLYSCALGDDVDSGGVCLLVIPCIYCAGTRTMPVESHVTRVIRKEAKFLCSLSCTIPMLEQES